MSYTEEYRKYWDRFILVLAIINSIFVPVQLSFDPPELKTAGYIVWDSIVDLFFLLDLILKFFTTYQSSNGKEEFDSTLIAKHYIYSLQFALDTMSMIGNTLFTYLFPSLKIFRLLKMARIFRLNSLIKRANIGKIPKALLTMLKLSFYLFLILHTFACFWYSSITFELSESMDGEKLYPDEPWYAPLFWLNFADQDLYAPDKDLGSKYWTMLYYSILFLGCNELGPVSNMNFLFCVLILLVCAFVNAFVFGDMAAVVATLQAGDRTEEEIDSAYAIYEQIDLSNHLIAEINSYFRQSKPHR